MTTPASSKLVKRNRSFSSTRDKDSNKEETARSSEEEEKGMGDSTESEKDVRSDHNNKKPEISRSSSPEQFGSRYESDKESGSEEASSSLGSQRASADGRRRIPSTSTDLTLTKNDSLSRYSRKTSSSDYETKHNHHLDVESNESGHHSMSRYSRKTSSTEFDSTADQIPTRKVSNDSTSRYSRKTSSTDFESKSNNHHPDVEPSKYQTKKLSNESLLDYSFPRYTRKTSSSDYSKPLTDYSKPVSQFNGRDDYDFVPSKDNDRRRHSAPGGNSEKLEETGNDNQYQPPPPTYKPKCTVDTSTTYSYYTRIRSRADEARRREAEAEKNTSTTTQSSVTHSVTNSVTTSPVINARNFNYRRNRAATIERDMEVTVTVTEQPVTTVEPATSSWRSRIYGETSREAASYYPVRRRRPQSPETVTPPVRHDATESQHSTSRASRYCHFT
jgi:hypothetical protein